MEVEELNREFTRFCEQNVRTEVGPVNMELWKELAGLRVILNQQPPPPDAVTRDGAGFLAVEISGEHKRFAEGHVLECQRHEHIRLRLRPEYGLRLVNGRELLPGLLGCVSLEHNQRVVFAGGGDHGAHKHFVLGCARPAEGKERFELPELCIVGRLAVYK